MTYLVLLTHIPAHTPSIAFRHLRQNVARIGYGPVKTKINKTKRVFVFIQTILVLIMMAKQGGRVIKETSAII